MSSDIDLVVLTDESEPYVGSSDWITSVASHDGQIVRTQVWGPLVERRVELPTGLLVEFGFAPLSWAQTDPLDAGTRKVIADGFRILYDPDGLLGRLEAALRVGDGDE